MGARAAFPGYQIVMLIAAILVGIGLVAFQERTLIHAVIFGKCDSACGPTPYPIDGPPGGI
jgi:hypothetical protein